MIFASFSALSLGKKIQVNIFRTGIIVLLLSLLASCKKEDEAAPVPENKWWYSTETFITSYTDVDTRTGYRITFFPEGTIALDHNVTLQFSEYPKVGTDYQISADPPSTGKVKVLLIAGPLPQYKSQSGSGAVHVDQVDGKLSFSADQVHMLRDTVSAVADALNLGFSLRTL